jgi:sirohydrochlorin ferrochelatase
VHEAVERARARRGKRRVAVASYLLADGLFQERLRASRADIVSQPLGTHPGLARLIADRFQRAAPHRCEAIPARRARC